jgi:hypothetical protein
MNDVPFAAFAIASLYFFIRGMRTDSALTIAVSLLLVSVTILTRQIGLALPVAFACALLTKKGVRTRYLFLAFMLVATGVAIQFAYQTWLHKSGVMPANFNNRVHGLLVNTRTGSRPLVRDGVRISFFCLMYLGLFALPALPFFSLNLQDDAKFSRRTSHVVIAAIPILLGVILIWIGRLMPLFENILDDGGIGPCTLITGPRPRAPMLFWAVVTGLALVGGAWVLRNLLSATVALYLRLQERSAKCRPWASVLLLTLTAICFVPLPLLGLSRIFDRYILIFITLAIATFACFPTTRVVTLRSSVVRGVGVALLPIYGLFSLAATHDYLAWNRARWAALHDLIRDTKISINDIQGGFEFYGWYRDRKDSKIEWRSGKYWEYLVSFEPFKGYQVIKHYTVPWWLLWERRGGDILVERKSEGQSSSQQDKSLLNPY